MSSRAARLLLASLLLPACSTDVNDGSVDPAVTRRVSVSAPGAEANRGSANPDVTPDGRYVVFESAAGNLVPGDLNGKVDVFRKDLRTGDVVLVSVSTAGEQGDGDSTNPSISDDGTRVAFQSQATNLAGTDGTSRLDVYVRKVDASETVHVSQAAAGGPPTGILTDPVSEAPRLSPDGRFVVFVSNGEDLDAFTPNFDQWPQIFLNDLDTGISVLLSVQPDGNPSAGPEASTPDVSQDGLFVVFTSTAGDLVAGDANGAEDVFVRDVLGGSTRRLSIEHSTDPDGQPDGEDANGGSRNPRVSADGRVVVFESDAPDLVPDDLNAQTDVFRIERVTGDAVLASRSLSGLGAANASRDAAVSSDGRRVAYRSLASNLVQSDTNNQDDHFWYDPVRALTYRVSVRTGGAQSSAHSEGRPALTRDGRFVVFSSPAPELVVGDSNGAPDIFIRGPLY